MKRIQGSCGRQGQAASTLPSAEHHAHHDSKRAHTSQLAQGPARSKEMQEPTNPRRGPSHMSALPSGPTATTALRPGSERCSLS